MPSNPRVVVAPQARDDIRDIRQYSVEQWGAESRNWQRERLTTAIKQLGDYPHIGQARNDLGNAHRRKLVDPYVIHDRIDGDAVRVLRVLHVRRDAPALIGEDDAPTSAG